MLWVLSSTVDVVLSVLGFLVKNFNPLGASLSVSQVHVKLSVGPVLEISPC